MSISALNLTGSVVVSTNTVYTTATVPLAANQLAICAVLGVANGGGSSIPTATTPGLTWTLIASLEYVTGVNSRRVNIFRALPTTSMSAAVTATFGVAQIAAGWSVAQFSGVDLSGGEAGAIVQSSSATATSNAPSVALPGASALNATYGIVGGSSGTFSAGVPAFTVLFAQGAMATEWNASGLTPVQFSASVSNTWGLVAVEILAASPPVPAVDAPGVNLVTNNEQELIAWRS